MSNCIFVGVFTGVGKSGKQYTRVTLIEKSGRFFRQRECFTKNGEKLANQDSLKFGDVVKPELSIPQTIDGKAELLGLKVIRNTPYSDSDFTE